ncbi:phage portal protein [Nocardiopsis mwathae]|nr:phage portal protein [Nocardiopsis mwathae]
MIVSGGKLDLVRGPGGYQLPSSMQLGAEWVEYGEIYRRQPQVRTVVAFLARNIAQLGLHVYRRVSDTDRERVTDHPLAKLLARPLPQTKLTRFGLMFRVVADLCIYDAAFVVKVRDGSGSVVGLIPVPAAWVAPEGGSWIAPHAYRIAGGSEVPAGDVIHLHGYATDSLWGGTSPLESLRSVLIEEHEANRHRQQMWRNGARTSGFIQRPVPKGGRDWSDEARERFKREFADLYTGDGPGAGGVPVLEDGMTYVPAGLDPRAAQYIEARKLTREEVAAAYFVPPPLVGILDHATFSNIRAQHEHLYQDTLGPLLTQIDEAFEAQLADEFGDLYLEFNIQEKLRGSFEEQAAAASTSAGAPWMTVNEVRARNNLPALDGGDELVTPLNVAKGGQASPRDSAPDPSVRDDDRSKTRTIHVKAGAPERAVTRAERELSAFFGRQARSLSSLLGAAKASRPLTKDAADAVNWGRWQDELALVLSGINVSTASASASAALEEMGTDPDSSDFDSSDAVEWLMENAQGQAEASTETSRRQVEAALEGDDPPKALKALFAAWSTSRAAELAARQTMHVAGYTRVNEARKVFGSSARKTWRTTTRNPRATHSRLNGQTVPIDAKFSNGARWPGDSVLPAKEAAKCKCQLSITGVMEPDEE